MRLFKYLHPDRANVLFKGCIRFSSPLVLNDPFELKPHIAAIASRERIYSELAQQLPKVIAEEYRKLPSQLRAKVSLRQFQLMAKTRLPQAQVEAPAMFDMALPKVKELLTQKVEELIGILCLTESPHNLLMWAHYADSHRGFVLEFDSESPFFNQALGPEDEFRHLRKVVYCEERPSLVLSEVEDFMPFLTKGKDWSYEAEWRMMMPLDKASRTIGDGPLAIHLFDFPSSAIRGITLGCRMDTTKKAEILEFLQGNSNYQHVQISETVIDEERYCLLSKEVVS